MSNRVSKRLWEPNRQKELKELRRFGYEQNPLKFKRAVTNTQAGFFKPKCEALDQELLEKPNEVKIEPHVPTVAEVQDATQKERGWVRGKNSKLYDKRLTELIADSSNGFDVLQQEVDESGERLSKVKSGARLR